MFFRPIMLTLSALGFPFLVILASLVHQNKEIIPNPPALSIWDRSTRFENHSLNAIAYYSFQDELLAKGRIRNRISPFAVSFKDFFKATDNLALRTVEGRWPGKQAVELDRDSLRLSGTGLTGDTFTLSAWIRHSGLGMVRGGNFENAASIIAIGDGVWTGWSLDLLQPSNRIVFNIARSKTESRIGVVSTIRFPAKTWSHITISRDPTTIRIFVNGIPAGFMQHSALPSQVASPSNLKVGYIGNGLSSAKFQIDELRVFASPLSQEQILADALQHSPELLNVPNTWSDITTAYSLQQYEHARHLLSTTLNSIPLDSPLRPPLRFRLSQIEEKTGNIIVAINILRDLAQDKSLDSCTRNLALHNFLMLKAGVDQTTDPDPPNILRDYSPDYRNLSQASPKYEDAMIEYDFCVPLGPDSVLPLD